MADYTIVLSDTSGVYTVSKVYRGGTTTNNGTDITPANPPQDKNPFVPALFAILHIKNDKAAGN